MKDKIPKAKPLDESFHKIGSFHDELKKLIVSFDTITAGAPAIEKQGLNLKAQLLALEAEKHPELLTPEVFTTLGTSSMKGAIFMLFLVLVNQALQ